MVKFFLLIWGKLLPNIKILNNHSLSISTFFLMVFHEKKKKKSLAQFKQLQKCHSLRQPLHIRMHNEQSNRVIIKHVLKGHNLMKLTILTDS